uniref:Uncharacterized protein n=1 Tax=Manihot esculenta TaxID=3983 RepID=A0A2C9V552_MANES
MPRAPDTYARLVFESEEDVRAGRFLKLLVISLPSLFLQSCSFGLAIGFSFRDWSVEII